MSWRDCGRKAVSRNKQLGMEVLRSSSCQSTHHTLHRRASTRRTRLSAFWVAGSLPGHGENLLDVLFCGREERLLGVHLQCRTLRNSDPPPTSALHEWRRSQSTKQASQEIQKLSGEKQAWQLLFPVDIGQDSFNVNSYFQINCRFLKLVCAFRPTMMWSCTSTPSLSPACTIFLVISISASDGVGSPEG
jgi:hypothetical protein